MQKLSAFTAEVRFALGDDLSGFEADLVPGDEQTSVSDLNYGLAALVVGALVAVRRD